MLSALTIGTHVPDDFTGEVFSVHPHAINLRRHTAPGLISIVDRGIDLTGLSILTPSLPEAVRQGTAVRVTEGRLQIAGSNSSRAALVWDDDVPRFTGELPGPRRRISAAMATGVAAGVAGRVVDHYRQLLESYGNRGGLWSLGCGAEPDNLYARRADALLESDAAIAGNRAEEGRATAGAQGPLGWGDRLAGLVGLGPGFTPSGDDFICGALAAAELIARVEPAPSGTPRFMIDTDPVLSRLNATTPGGAALLWLACRQSFPAYLLSFVAEFATLLEERPPARGSDASAADDWVDTAAASMREAVTHGATSGTDAVAGFLWLLCAVFPAQT